MSLFSEFRGDATHCGAAKYEYKAEKWRRISTKKAEGIKKKTRTFSPHTWNIVRDDASLKHAEGKN